MLNKTPLSAQWITTEGYENLSWSKGHHCERNITSFFLIQQALERQRTAEKERLFLVYAKQWWREFLEIRPSHQSKMVKIFAQVCVHLCGAGANRNLNNTQTFSLYLRGAVSLPQSVSTGWERRQPAGVFLRACPPGRTVAGEPSTRGALCQPSCLPESSGGGRRKQTGAVVHIDGFPV